MDLETRLSIGFERLAQMLDDPDRTSADELLVAYREDVLEPFRCGRGELDTETERLLAADVAMVGAEVVAALSAARERLH
jgi:hypothetical protein